MKIRKSVFALVLAVTMLFSTAIGAVASNGIEKIQASLNHNIKFLLNGSAWSPKDPSGKTLSALVYKGSTYVPLRSVSEALGAAVDWDASTSTITIDGDDNNGIPYNDASSNNSGTKPSTGNTNNSGSNSNNSGNSNKSNTSAPSAGTTTATASLSDPVPFGQTFKYSDKNAYDDIDYSFDYAITVTNVEILTHSQAVDLRYNVKNDDKIEYALVTLNTSMSNAKVKASSEDGLMTSVYFRADIWGSKTTNNQGIIGGTNHGFEGSLSDALFDNLGISKISVGKTGSYDITGKIIIPITKGSTNYLVLTKKDRSDYQASQLHFKLK